MDIQARPSFGPTEDPEREVRLHFHVALAGILLALLAPIVSWGLWLADRRAPAGRWKRRLLALAIVDTVLVIGLATSAAAGLDLNATTRRPPHIGVVLDARESPGGVLVERVVPASPAAAASIRPGDRIVAIDGAPIEHNRELTRAIGATPEGSVRRITVVHDGERVDLMVMPSSTMRGPQRSARSLFEPVESEGAPTHGMGRTFLAGAGVLELALAAGFVIAARWRKAPAAPGLAVFAGLLALTMTSTIVLLLFRAIVGLSLGAVLLALLSGSAALLVVGLVGARLASPGPLQVGPLLRTTKAVALGVLYAAAGSARLAILLTILVAALGLPIHEASEAFGLDLSWGPVGVGIFLVATVIVAPVAEELVFRGILLPWLARWMRPTTALVWSSTLFAIGHAYYGVGALLIAYYGLVFGWARLRTGKLWAPISLHALLNGTTAAALLAGHAG